MAGKASPRSFNNEIGVPLTLLAVDAEDRYLIAEIGTNAPGEVAALARIVEPDVGVITSIGEAHLEGLGSVAAVAKEKASLLSFVRDGGLAVVNIDREEILPRLDVGRRITLTTLGCTRRADVVARVVDASLHRTVVELNRQHRIELPLPGSHHATNVAAVVTVAQHLGVGTDVVVERLRSFSPQAGRADVAELGPVTLVDDAYNANPSSMAGAVETLTRVSSRRRVMIMGDMFELGDQSGAFHAAMIDRAFASGIELVVTVGRSFTRAAADRPRVGGRALYCFEDASLAAAATPALVRSGDCVWVKGSRAMGLECIVDRLRRDLAPQVAVA
jgi:UDP-N-acetylmuramoyl-tripeptide--D-alanyl-D-alanine ligase